MRGGLTMTADAPRVLAWRLNSTHVRTPSADAPTMTLARPAAVRTTVSTISARSRSVRREASPVTPSAVTPATLARTTRSTTRARLSRSTSPPPLNGVGSTEYTPSNVTDPPPETTGNSIVRRGSGGPGSTGYNRKL